MTAEGSSGGETKCGIKIEDFLKVILGNNSKTGQSLPLCSRHLLPHPENALAAPFPQPYPPPGPPVKRKGLFCGEGKGEGLETRKDQVLPRTELPRAGALLGSRCES